MRTFCVGDIHGCFTELQDLLKSVCFSFENGDLLWSTGDIIGRGPEPIETLQFFLKHRDQIVTVLGNHELSLLRNYSLYKQCSSEAEQNKFLKELKASELKLILAQPNSEEIFSYLRSLPLAYYDPNRRLLLVHAGLSPEWNSGEALYYAKELEQVLKSDELFHYFMSNMFSDKQSSWRKIIQKESKKIRKLEKKVVQQSDNSDKIIEPIILKKLIYIVNAFTRMRFCYADQSLEFLCKGTLEEGLEQDLVPWYDDCLNHKILPDEKVIFGHWAALKCNPLQQDNTLQERVIALDSGCVWHGALTMIDVDQQLVRHVAQAHH